MTQKHRTEQSKLIAARKLLEDLEVKTAKDVKDRLEDNWQENLFEILMTRMELALPHRADYTAIPHALRHHPHKIPEFAAEFFKRMQNILILAKAPSSTSNVLSFGMVYLSIIDIFSKDQTNDLSKTMATIDHRISFFQKLTKITSCDRLKR